MNKANWTDGISTTDLIGMITSDVHSLGQERNTHDIKRSIIRDHDNNLSATLEALTALSNRFTKET